MSSHSFFALVKHPPTAGETEMRTLLSIFSFHSGSPSNFFWSHEARKTRLENAAHLFLTPLELFWSSALTAPFYEGRTKTRNQPSVMDDQGNVLSTLMFLGVPFSSFRSALTGSSKTPRAHIPPGGGRRVGGQLLSPLSTFPREEGTRY